MRINISGIRAIIREALTEIAGPSGGLRGSKKHGSSSSGRKVKLGKIDDDNKELSPFEAEHRFPGSTEAWAEIVPETYKSFPFSDPKAIIHASLWFKIGDQLRVAFKEMPQIELMFWDPKRQDWFEIPRDGVTDNDGDEDDMPVDFMGAFDDEEV